MHAILYGPENPKKQGTKKADKDITREERQSQEAQKQFFDSQRNFVTQEMLLDFQNMMRAMSAQISSRK